MSKRFTPAEVLSSYEKIRDDTSVEDFFNRPGHSKTQELWVAGHFGQGYANCFNDCFIWIDEEDIQHEFDFELEVKETMYPFQVTEVQQPNRRRGEEYKNDKNWGTRLEDWSPGTEFGPQWIEQAIQKKVNKNYADSDRLNLLIYVNFPAYEQKYEAIKARCEELGSKFASTWLITGDAICCITDKQGIGALDGWYRINQSVYPHPGGLDDENEHQRNKVLDSPLVSAWEPERLFGETTNGWSVSEPVTMTTRAKSAWMISRENQTSLIENRNGDWYYMVSYDTSVLPPNDERDNYQLSIRGKDVRKALGLQDALESLGLEKPDALEAFLIIAKSNK